MDDGFVAIAIVFMAVVMPLVIVFHYRTRWKAMQGPSAADLQETLALREAAMRMEQRIENLESVLDSEAPGWRSRSGLR